MGIKNRFLEIGKKLNNLENKKEEAVAKLTELKKDIEVLKNKIEFLFKKG
ncbi:MAG: hypothetical protein KKC53_01515 [Actinobacteria bacterium]|nr:hypothetical protein [Actinomycetota bacterium]